VLQQLRFGRGLDNRRLKATGFRFRYTTRETVLKLREHQRLGPLLRSASGAYRYEREVEDFLRWSPSVRRSLGSGDADGARPAVAAPQRPRVDDLEAQELVALLPSLEPPDLEQLREHEAAHRARAEVLEAIDRALR
jgi:UDP-glucose 4-epimerase